MLDRRTINVLLTTLVFVLAVALVYVVRTILVLFAFSILFAYLINPAVRILQRYSLFFKDLKGPHIFQAYLAFLILLGSLFYAFAPDFHSRPVALVGQLPAFADSVASGEIANSFGKNLGWSDARTVSFKNFLERHRSDIESATQNVQRSALKIASAVFVIPILAIFFLSDGEKLANQLILLILATSDGSAARSLVADLNVMLQRYIRAKVILGMLSFLFSSVALLALGFPHWLALGPIAGMLEFIPIAGWIMAATTITTLGVVTHSHWIWMLALLGIWRVVMDYAISPRVMGHQLEIHPLLAIFTVMVGGAVGGIVGIYISIPLVATAASRVAPRAHERDVLIRDVPSAAELPISSARFRSFLVPPSDSIETITVS
jgi:predicted PurR-regulated permease PerM